MSNAIVLLFYELCPAFLRVRVLQDEDLQDEGGEDVEDDDHGELRGKP